MNRPSWLTDTLARRIAVAEALVVAGTLGLVVAFNNLGVWWLKDPVNQSGILNEVIDIVRILEAAPVRMRVSLAAAATTEAKRVYWVSPESSSSQVLNSTKGHEGVSYALVGDTLHRSVVVLEPGYDSAPIRRTLDSQYPLRYLVAVRLQDGSWAVFATAKRTWGLARGYRWAILLTFLAGSMILFTAIVARQLAAPIKDLAKAAHDLGINPSAPAIPESGPRELRQVARTFNEMQAKIQQFIAHRTMMLAAISHDLRTPLTRMRLRGEYIEDLEQQARLFRDVDEMQAMVDGALAFFRDDAIAEPSTAFDLSQLMATVVNDYADQGVTIPYEGPGKAPYHGRPFMLKRVVNNLVQNSLKYASSPRLQLGAEDSAYVVCVRDAGPGIPEGLLKDVFLPYYRLEKSRNRRTGGVGLGLTVALAIVQAHGGAITLENIPAGGLEARIWLPLPT